MPTKKLILKRNDLQPYYYAKAKDSDNAAINLTGATIVCTMKSRLGAIKINRQSAGINITDAAGGLFEYQWQTGDTDTAGLYYIEFEITPASGGKYSIPVDFKDIAMVEITADLDNI